MRSRSTLLSSLWTCVWISAFAVAADAADAADAAEPEWSQFRGPGGQGHADGALPTAWSRTEGVLWRTEIPGKGWSSPTVHRGRIWLTTAVEEAGGEQSLRVVAVDPGDGRKVLEREVFRHGTARIHSKNSHASPTPVGEEGAVYVHFGTHGTARLDLEGRTVWACRELEYSPVHGGGGSPALTKRSLIISCDGGDRQFVVALDKETGKERWRTPRPPHSGKGFSFSTPLVIEVEGRERAISAGSDWVCAYDVETGEEIWRANYPGGYSVVPRPVVGHGLVFVASGYDSPELHAIRLGGKGDVTRTHLAWTLRRGAPNNPSPLLVGDDLFVVSDRGIATCLDARTGEEIWKERIGGGHSASPLHAAGRIYFLDESGDATVIAAGREFRVLAKSSIGERCLASLGVVDGSLLLRSAEALYRIGPASESASESGSE